MAKFRYSGGRSKYAYDLRSRSDMEAVRDFGPEMTQQSQKDDADINVIVKRFGLTGHLPEFERLPIEEDYVEVTSFHQAQAVVVAAREQFMLVPADIRAQFQNDPGNFVAFCSDPANLPKLRDMGLAPAAPVPPPEPPPLKVKVVPDAPPAPAQ